MTPDEPPECVRWIDDDYGVLEVRLTRPLIEWLDLEAAEHGVGVATLVRRYIWNRLTTDLDERHSIQTEATIDVPEDFAERASLWAADRKLNDDVDYVEFSNFVFNYLRIQHNWRVGGEPWLLDADPDDLEGDGQR